MHEDKYLVSVDGDVIAQNMQLTYALILAKALMYEYYAEGGNIRCYNKTGRVNT